jgi:hypothetical protein
MRSEQLEVTAKISSDVETLPTTTSYNVGHDHPKTECDYRQRPKLGHFCKIKKSSRTHRRHEDIQGSGSTTPPILNPSIKMEVSGKAHATTTWPPQTLVPTEHEAGLAPQSVRTFRRHRTGIVQSVAQSLHWLCHLDQLNTIGLMPYRPSDAIKKFYWFLEPECALQCSQSHATETHTNPVEIRYVTLPPTLRESKWRLGFGVPFKSE